MRRELVGVGMLLSLAGCPTTNTVDDAAASPDASSDLDAAVIDAYAVPDSPPPSMPDVYVADTWFTSSFDTGPSSRDAAPRPDGAVDVGPAPSDVTFILGTYDLPPAPRGPSMNESPGLDLDGRVSVEGGAGSCEDFIGDLVSPRGEPGVDNQLVASLQGLFAGFISSFDMQAELDRGVSSGERLIAVQLHDLDDWIDDASVTVDLFLVSPEGCADVCAPAGGVVAIDGRWMRRGPAIGTGLSGEIVDRELHVAIEAFPLSLAAGDGGDTLTLTLRDAILEAELTPTSLEGGAIAGGIVIDELVELADTIMPGIGEVARGILTDLADLSPSAADPAVCEVISAGLGFTAQRGTVD